MTATTAAPQKQGRGLAWARDVLKAQNLPGQERILLLAQPRLLGHVFNPVSFWLCMDAQDTLRVVIAEVSNTFGQRHSYLCYKDDLSPITAKDILAHKKSFMSRRFSRSKVITVSNLTFALSVSEFQLNILGLEVV